MASASGGSGVGGVDIGPGEIGHQEAGNSRPRGSQERQGRRVAKHGDVLFADQSLDLAVQSLERFGMNAGGQRDCRGTVGGIAIAGRVHGARVARRTIGARPDAAGARASGGTDSCST